MNYNGSLYNSRSLRLYAERFLAVMDTHYPKVTRLISAGMSGGAIASAMLTLAPTGKDKELTHTHYYTQDNNASHRGHEKSISGALPPLDYPIDVVIVDDIMCAGTTILALKGRVLSSVNIVGVIIGRCYAGTQGLATEMGCPIHSVDNSETYEPIAPPPTQTKLEGASAIPKEL